MLYGSGGLWWGLGMPNPEHLAILKQGVEAWNEWKSKTTEKIDLSGAALSLANLKNANLVGVKLDHANLIGAELNCANLTDAHLTGADVSVAKLKGANLTRANLMGAIFDRADLSGVNFTEAYFIGANVSNTKLDNTNLTASILGGTIFADVDLSATRGLESANHHSPSTIGIDTLYKSKGQIPEVFLRGCGVPDSFIAQAKALIGAEEGIQFYSCFISYSGLDDEFARRLHGRLQQEHVRVWFAPHDIQGGKKLHEQIDEAIKVYDKLLILLSPNSLQSEWVMTELRKARKAERKTGKRKLFPVGLVDYATLQDWECFDADGGKDLAVEVREYFIPDFSNWKDHDAFEKGFARLLKDLRAEEKAAG